jgi:hypothetical protein
MYLAETKDRQIVRALEQHDDELEKYFEDDDEPENDLTEDAGAGVYGQAEEQVLRR